ncbi:MAG: hypothetical protein H0U45_07590 [Tatlockia sp.]|nr:hypothetical protein [Tatlockia sp.]
MGVKFKSLTGALVIFATVCIGSTAKAQTSPANQYSQYETLSDRFDRVFYTNDKEYSENRSLLRQLDFLIGIGGLNNSFVENEITADTKAITVLYKDELLKQGSSDRVVRTRDLPNPYDTSILQSPRININGGVEPTQQ